MTLHINAYLNFEDRAREALEFYQSVFGGELVLDTFGESGMSEDPADADKLMHGQLETPFGMRIMASDSASFMDKPVMGTAVNVSLNGDDDAIDGYWEKLSEGAEIVAPYEKAPWGDMFGLLNDRFSVAWLVNKTGPQG